MEKNVTDIRLEMNDPKEDKSEVTRSNDVTTSEKNSSIPSTSTSSETKLFTSRACYVLSKSNNPATIESAVLTDGTLNSDSQMSVIKLTSSKENPVYICCFGAKTKQSCIVENSSESLTSQMNGNASFGKQLPSPQSKTATTVENLSSNGRSETTQTKQTDGTKSELKSISVDHSCEETSINQPNIVPHTTSDIQVTSKSAESLGVTTAKIPTANCTNDNFCHITNKEETLVPSVDCKEKYRDIPSCYIHNELKVSHIGQNIPSSVHTACNTAKDEQAYLSSKVLPTIDESDNGGKINSNCKTNQKNQIETQLNTIRQSIDFKPVSTLGIVGNWCSKIDSASTKEEPTFSPSTTRLLPSKDHLSLTSNQITENSDCLSTESWDPFSHHHEMNMALPHDLRCLKENELLPMAYSGDFTKYLENDELCCTPAEMMRSAASEDCVVPSSPLLLPGDKMRCFSVCSDTSTDGSQEYSWECFSPRNEDIYKSPSLKNPLDYPQYGTLNWGLTPTIIYKIPDPDTPTQDVSDNYMKCSISAGNVELLTPPPPNYKKLLRRTRRRMERRHVKRRRIYFGNDENCRGLQEVPVNEREKDNDQPLDTGEDFVPDDPMWFEDECDEKTLGNGEDKPFSSVNEEEIKGCYENLENMSPKCKESHENSETYQILTEAAEYIKNLDETLDGFNSNHDENTEVIDEERSNDTNKYMNSCEDILEGLPLISWNEMDEQSDEIQEILNNLSQSEHERSLESFEMEATPSTDSSMKVEEKKESNKRKRKCRRYIFSRKKKASKRLKKPSSLDDNPSQNDDDDDTITSEAAQYDLDDNSSTGSQRSNDCKSIACDVSPTLKEKATAAGSSNSNTSQGSRCVTPVVTPICSSPGVLLSPTVAGFIPLTAIGKPLILPKPTHQDNCFSPTFITSPQQLLPSLRVISPASSVPVSSSAWSQSPGSPNKVTARKYPTRLRSKQKNEDMYKYSVEKTSPKKTVPNGYMLYCKEKRNSVLKENRDLVSQPGNVTKLLSENWNKLTEEERRPYLEEAMKLRHDENEWVNKTP